MLPIKLLRDLINFDFELIWITFDLYTSDTKSIAQKISPRKNIRRKGRQG